MTLTLIDRPTQPYAIYSVHDNILLLTLEFPFVASALPRKSPKKAHRHHPPPPPRPRLGKTHYRQERSSSTPPIPVPAQINTNTLNNDDISPNSYRQVDKVLLLHLITALRSVARSELGNCKFRKAWSALSY